MKYALTALVTLAALGLLALVFPYTGLYNVSAAEGHTGFMRWYLNTTTNNSIKARADAAVPADLADEARVQRAAASYDAMCVVCHGAPGVERGEFGKGLTPEPPRLSHAATMWEPEEVFWILDEGIKMAGMPAFGVTHPDDALWDLVAFVERLPEMTPEQYRVLVAASPGHHEGGEHGEAEPAEEGSTADEGHAHRGGDAH